MKQSTFLHVDIKNQELIEKYQGGCVYKWLWPPWSQGKWINEWMNFTNFLHFDANSGTLRIAFIIFGWLWSKMGMGL